MTKLITKFRETNSAKDALKLLVYLDKHPFAEVLAPLSDRVLVDTLHAVYCAKAA